MKAEKHSIVRRREGFQGQKLIVLPKKIITNFLSIDPLTREIYITDIGYYPKAKFHYAERPTGINQHIIIYCTEGNGWVEINKKKIPVSPSQFIAIPANTPHKYGADENRPWTIYWVHFKGQAAAFFIDLILQNSQNYKPYLSYNNDRIKLFEIICTNLERGYGTDILRYVNMTFTHFLSSLVYDEMFNNQERNNEPNIIERTVSFMQENITRMLKLEDLAVFANLSASHFSYIFKSKTGHAPIEYFNQLKIQQACQYIAFTNMSVKNIALTLGIEDQYYFSRMFTKLMGSSPSDYKKKLNRPGAVQ
jgi:AraC family transcriptional regulator of arabinose operon